MATEVDLVAETAAKINQGVMDAHKVAGFVVKDSNGDAMFDVAAFRLSIFEQISTAKAENKSERKQNALTRGALAKALYPKVDDEAADEVGVAVWAELLRLVWSETNSNHSGAVQRLVGEIEDADGVGYTLCRTKVSIDGNAIDAVYITTSYKLIEDDFTSPLGASVTRAAKKYASNATMLIQRGHDAKKVRRGLDSAMKNAALLAKSTVELALPPANGDSDGS